MKHPRFEEISAFIDRELPEERMRELQEHIGVCKECRERVDFLRALDKMIRKTQKEWDVERFASEVMERVHSPRRIYNFALKIATIGIAASIIFGFAFTNIRVLYRENLDREKYQLITQHQIISSGDMGIIFISEKK